MTCKANNGIPVVGSGCSADSAVFKTTLGAKNDDIVGGPFVETQLGRYQFKIGPNGQLISTGVKDNLGQAGVSALSTSVGVRSGQGDEAAFTHDTLQAKTIQKRGISASVQEVDTNKDGISEFEIQVQRHLPTSTQGIKLRTARLNDVLGEREAYNLRNQAQTDFFNLRKSEKEKELGCATAWGGGHLCRADAYARTMLESQTWNNGVGVGGLSGCHKDSQCMRLKKLIDERQWGAARQICRNNPKHRGCFGG